jgi:hypothetical protein
MAQLRGKNWGQEAIRHTFTCTVRLYDCSTAVVRLLAAALLPRRRRASHPTLTTPQVRRPPPHRQASNSRGPCGLQAPALGGPGHCMCKLLSSSGRCSWAQHTQYAQGA